MKITLFSEDSTSLHTLNGEDKSFFGLFLSRLFYFPFNRLNNLFPIHFVDPHLKISLFRTDQVSAQFNELDIKGSPARKLSDLFWMNLEWNKINSMLNGIHLMDLGCGSGNYYKFQKYSHNIIQSYLGIDVYEHLNWGKLKNQDGRIDFRVYDGCSIRDVIPEKTNLIVSQSSIEHIYEDLLIFRQIAEHIRIEKKPTMQIHILPAAVSLILYRYHGVRQYTPRTISLFSKLFSDFSKMELFCLGNQSCCNLHYDYITKAQFYYRKNLRNSKTEEYEQKCLAAIDNDMKSKALNHAKTLFYALVIRSFA